MIAGQRVVVRNQPKTAPSWPFVDGVRGVVVSVSGASVIVQLDGAALTTVADDGSEVVIETVGETVVFPEDHLELEKG